MSTSNNRTSAKPASAASTTVCDFCQQIATKLDHFSSLPFPVFQCASFSTTKKCELDESALPNMNDISKLVFCQAEKSFSCSLALKFPGRCNLTDNLTQNKNKFTIFDCSKFTIHQHYSYQVSLPRAYFYVSKSCLHGANFVCESGNVNLSRARVVSTHSNYFHSSGGETIDNFSTVVFYDEIKGEEYVLRNGGSGEFQIDQVYSLSHFAKQSQGNNLLERALLSTVQPAAQEQRNSSVKDFLLDSQVPAFTSGTTRVYFRNLKQELLFLVAKYELCLCVCYTGPDLDFIKQFTGKCVGLVAQKPQQQQQQDFEQAILSLPMATDAKGKPIMQSKALLYASGNVYEMIHSKFVVFGKRVGSGKFFPQAVWTGSFNLTENSSKQCVENAVLISDEQVALQYVHEFQRVHGFVAAAQPKPVVEDDVRLATPPKSASQQDEIKQRSQRKPIKTPGKLMPTSSSPLPSPNLLAGESPKSGTPASFFTPKEGKTDKRKPQAPNSTASVYFTPKQTNSNKASKQQNKPKFNSETPPGGKGLSLEHESPAKPAKTVVVAAAAEKLEDKQPETKSRRSKAKTPEKPVESTPPKQQPPSTAAVAEMSPAAKE